VFGDRRFQFDRSFTYVAFSHEQVRASVSGGYLLTSRSNFSRVAEKILEIDVDALDAIIARTEGGQYTQAETDAERKCFELMSLVDHVSSNVHGSNARRKTQRSEIRSLIFEKGVPVFFVTFAPADIKNPVCISICGKPLPIPASRMSPSKRWDGTRCVLKNPVGAAQFFHRTVDALLQVFLGIDGARDGVFGRTAAYYGTVE
ncbi:hypothetical protein FKP32DRAFT_1532027, partial [Trametes sanguinea]